MTKPKHWEVEIRVDGEVLLTIGSNHLSGVEDIDGHAEIIRNCAQHLLSFIGPATAAPTDYQF